MDSSFDQTLDNGRKLSIIYFCNLNLDEKKVQIFTFFRKKVF